MSTSQAQIEANRANSQLSTGPTSEAGKQASAANSTSTGLTGTKIFVAPGQEQQFLDFKVGLIAQICPESPLQLQLFDVLLHAAWNILRCIDLEEQIQNEAISLGLPDALFDDDLSRKLDRIYRYKKMHESTQRKIIAQLRVLQTEQIWRRETQECLLDSDLADTQAISIHLRKRAIQKETFNRRDGLEALKWLTEPPAPRAKAA